MSAPSTSSFFTASDVARFCQVDLKTIHNWADKGEIRHFRTPGRHLRFRRLDILDFLRKFGYPVPAIVQQLGAQGTHGKPVVAFIERDSTKLAEVVEKLSGSFEVRTFTDKNAALISMGEAPADVLVFDTDTVSPALVKSLAATERLAHTRCIVFSARAELEREARAAGVYDFVKRPMWSALESSILRVLGVEKEPAA